MPLLSFLTSLLGNIFNYFSTQTTNKTNQAINDKNLDFQKSQTEDAWARDDTQHQREVADLEAAGLSPLASMQGNSTSAPLGASSPIAMQAPQIDVNGMMNAMLRKEELEENKRHNKVKEGYEETELGFQATEIMQKYQEIDIQNQKVKNEYKYQCDLINMQAKNLEELSRHNKEIEELENISKTETARHNVEMEELQKTKNMLEEESERSKRYHTELEKEMGGRKIPYKEYENFDEYTSALQNYNAAFYDVLDKLSTGTRNANSETKQGGASIGGDVQKFGLNLSGQGSHSEYQSQDVSKYQEQLINDFYNNNKFPIYAPDIRLKAERYGTN